MKWTTELDSKLEELFKTKNIYEVSDILGLSKSSIRNRAGRLKINTGQYKHEKVTCLNCNTEFESLKNYKRKFCSSNCSAIYNNQTRLVKRKIKPREYSQVGKVSDCKPDSIGSNPITLSRFCKHCDKELINIKKGYQCNTCVARIRRFELKKKAVAHKGGKCERCGYDKHLAALEFHHSDPSKKDFTISKKHNYKWDSLVEEINKCILLCSNCHRIEHSKYNEFI